MAQAHPAAAAVPPAAPASPEDIRRRLVEQLFNNLVEQASALPLRSQAALVRVISLCEDARASARGVALEAARDESFSALLLRIANSAHSMSASRIGDLTQAVARLGFGFVQGLAVASIAAPGLGTGMDKNIDEELAEALRQQHRHSVRVGLIARALAPSGVSPEVALTAGLLHNLGLSVLALFAPKAFRHLLTAAARGDQLPPVELETLGFTHAQLGAALAERWSYPAPLVSAIGGHDAEAPADRLAALIQVADLLVREAGAGIEPARDVRPEVALAAGVDVRTVGQRLRPLLDAQDRLDERMQKELEESGASL